MDNTRNNVNVNFNAVIELLIDHLNNKPVIELIEREVVNQNIANDEDYADRLGIEIPSEDFNSEDSLSGFSPETDINTTTLYGSKKNNYVRRLQRRLWFFILPRENMPPPYITICEKKQCLRRYLRALNVPQSVFVEWFIAE